MSDREGKNLDEKLFLAKRLWEETQERGRNLNPEQTETPPPPTHKSLPQPPGGPISSTPNFQDENSAHVGNTKKNYLYETPTYQKSSYFPHNYERPPYRPDLNTRNYSSSDTPKASESNEYKPTPSKNLKNETPDYSYPLLFPQTDKKPGAQNSSFERQPPKTDSDIHPSSTSGMNCPFTGQKTPQRENSEQNLSSSSGPCPSLPNLSQQSQNSGYSPLQTGSAEQRPPATGSDGRGFQSNFYTGMNRPSQDQHASCAPPNFHQQNRPQFQSPLQLQDPGQNNFSRQTYQQEVFLPPVNNYPLGREGAASSLETFEVMAKLEIEKLKDALFPEQKKFSQIRKSELSEELDANQTFSQDIIKKTQELLERQLDQVKEDLRKQQDETRKKRDSHQREIEELRGIVQKKTLSVCQQLKGTFTGTSCSNVFPAQTINSNIIQPSYASAFPVQSTQSSRNSTRADASNASFDVPLQQPSQATFQPQPQDNLDAASDDDYILQLSKFMY